MTRSGRGIRHCDPIPPGRVESNEDAFMYRVAHEVVENLLLNLFLLKSLSVYSALVQKLKAAVHLYALYRVLMSVDYIII